MIATTIWSDDPTWTDQTTLIDRRRHRSAAGFLREFLATTRHADCVIVVGSIGFNDRYRDLLAVALLKARRRRPAVVISDATWEVGSRHLARVLRSPRLASRVVRALLPRLVDGPHVTYCVLSTEEARTFPAAWGVDPARVVFTPFTYTMWGRVDDAPSDGGYLFAGGDSLRDYDLLLAAVHGLDIAVRLATHQPIVDTTKVVARPESADDYDSLLLGARVVVVPLVPAARSAGQQTYLSAMAIGKPVVVVDAPGVRDHITDGVDGLVVPPHADALRAAIEWMLDPANTDAVARMAAAARHTAREKFSPERYFGRLLEIARARTRA